MTYVHVVNGECRETARVKSELPMIGTFPDGRSVSGLRFLDDEDLAEAGWLVAREVAAPEDFDPETHQAVNVGYTLAEDGIPETAWEVRELPPPPPDPGPPDPSVQELIASLRATIESQGEQIAALSDASGAMLDDIFNLYMGGLDA